MPIQRLRHVVNHDRKRAAPPVGGGLSFAGGGDEIVPKVTSAPVMISSSRPVALPWGADCNKLGAVRGARGGDVVGWRRGDTITRPSQS